MVIEESTAVDAMLDAFEQARCALENLADLVAFSVGRPRGDWCREPDVSLARERLLIAQHEALEMADQVMGQWAAGGVGQPAAPILTAGR